MNYDEFAFFNQQLASLLREDIPLEGALKQLGASLNSEPLRTQVQALAEDLARGTPLPDALARRDLPVFYRRMVEIGARSNDLPGMLNLLAEHYQRANTLWVRLKGLMVYPVIVVVAALCLTLILALVFSHFLTGFFEQFQALPSFLVVGMWAPPLVLGAVTLALAVCFFSPQIRARLRWKLPAFREASLSQFASAMELMLRNGVPLSDALALAEMLEGDTSAGPAVAQWRALLQAGRGKPEQWPNVRPFPPLFLWLLRSHGENLAEGFRNAAEIFRARASYRIEMMLYGALPVSVLLLGQMVLWQAVPLMRSMVLLMNMLGSSGD